jgi:hypothetical protein
MREHKIHHSGSIARSCTEGHQFKSEVHSVWQEDKTNQVKCMVYCQEHCIECLDQQSEALARMGIEFLPEGWKSMLWSAREDIVKAYRRRLKDETS